MEEFHPNFRVLAMSRHVSPARTRRVYAENELREFSKFIPLEIRGKLARASLVPVSKVDVVTMMIVTDWNEEGVEDCIREMIENAHCLARKSQCRSVERHVLRLSGRVRATATALTSRSGDFAECSDADVGLRRTKFLENLRSGASALRQVAGSGLEGRPFQRAAIVAMGGLKAGLAWTRGGGEGDAPVIARRGRRTRPSVPIGEPCPICRDEFLADDVAPRLPCRHVFHSECLETWISSGPGRRTCPMCRRPLPKPRP